METESPSGNPSSTQPLSPTGVQLRDALQHVDRDDSSDDDDDRTACADIKGTTISDGAAQKTEEVANNNKVSIQKALVKVKTVAWTEHNNSTNQSYSGEGLAFRVVLDSLQRTGLIRLQASIQLKHHNLLNGSETIYLFIYPENIHAVTADERLDTLSFSLKRPPDLVVPKGRPIESEPATDVLLQSMFALAKVTHLDVQLSTSKLPRDRLRFILSIHKLFPVNHSFSTDKRRADLGTLYVGRGSEVINLAKDLEGPRDSPPSYQKDTSRPCNKRKRKCTSPDVERRRATTPGRASPKTQATVALAAGGNPRLEDIYNLLVEMNGRVTQCVTRIETRVEQIEGHVQRIESRVERIESRVERIESRVEQIDSRVEKIESRIEQIDSRVEQIEKSLASEDSEAPSQTMSEARLELLEELNDRIDNEIIDVQSRYAEATEELEEKIDHFESTVSEALEELERNVESYGEEVEERLEERIEQAVGKYLSNGTFQGSLFFNRQATADE
ncbi:hypothetical protein TgHK011_009456 [Trichoderma gracile]|nr:hypothetical protein TgHK011_009456 [Trichoderma gracile]